MTQKYAAMNTSTSCSDTISEVFKTLGKAGGVPFLLAEPQSVDEAACLVLLAKIVSLRYD